MNNLEKKLELRFLSSEELEKENGGTPIPVLTAIAIVAAAYKAGEAVGEAIYHAIN